MATTTLLDYHQPSSVFPTPDFYPKSKSANSSRYTSPILPSPKPTPSSSQAYLPQSRSHTPLSRSSLVFSKLDDDEPIAQRAQPSNHTKLHKKTLRGTSRSGQAGQRGAASDRAYTPPIAEGDRYLPEAASSRSVKLKQNLRKLTTQPKDDPTTIDLSRTAQENEERSGLTIQSQSQTHSPASPLTGDARSATKRGHGRSFSGASAQSGSTFTPTLPFVHPMRQEEQRSRSPFAGQASYHGSVMGKDYSLGNDLYGLGIDTAQSNQGVTGTARSSASHGYPRQRSSTDTSRQPLHLKTSEASTAAPSTRIPSNMSQSQPALSHASSYTSYAGPTTSTGTNMTKTTTPPSLMPRSRRNTTRSTLSSSTSNTHTPTSPRHSIATDHAFSLMRSSTLPSEPIEFDDDADTDITAINAARRAFTEKQEAKTAKYEKAERKEQEKREKKERRRSRAASESHGQKPKASGSPRTPTAGAGVEKDKRSAEKRREQANHDARLHSRSYTDLLQEDKASPPLRSGRVMDPSSLPMPRAAMPKVSRKRAAKSGYLGFWTWVRVRMMRFGEAKR